MKIFEIYKASQKRLFSLKDVINYDRSQIKNIVFVFAPEYEQQDKYFTIKIR